MSIAEPLAFSLVSTRGAAETKKKKEQAGKCVWSCTFTRMSHEGTIKQVHDT